MADVFISHARADRKRAEVIAEGLQAEGLSVVREETPLRPPALGLRAPVAESGCALVIWSRAGARVDELAIDAAQAFNQGKLAPVVLQRDIDLPPPYDLVEGIDLSGWRGRREEAPWRDLVQAVKATIADEGVGRVVRQAPPPAPPPRQAPPTPNLFAKPEKPAPAPIEERRFTLPPEEPQTGANRIVVFAASALAIFVMAIWAGPRVVDLVNRVSEPPKHAAIVPNEDLLDRPDQPDAPTPVETASVQSEQLDAPPLTVVAPPEAPKLGDPIKTAVEPRSVDTGIARGLAPATAKTVTPKPVSAPKVDVAPKPVAAKPTPPAPKPAPVIAVKPAPTPATKVAAVKPDAKTPTPKPETAAAATKPAAADPAVTMSGLEKCMAALAKICAAVDPAFAGTFAADGKLSAGERKLLTSPLFPDRSLVTADNVTACQGAVKAKTAPKTCALIAPKTPPAETSAKPAAPAATPAPKPDAPKPVKKAEPEL